MASETMRVFMERRESKFETTEQVSENQYRFISGVDLCAVDIPLLS